MQTIGLIIAESQQNVIGKPCYKWTYETAIGSTKLEDVYVASHDKDIVNAADHDGANTILLREKHRGQIEILRYCTEEIKKQYPDMLALALMYGNSVQFTSIDIDRCIAKTSEKEKYSGCITVYRTDQQHPRKALQLNHHGYIQTPKAISKLPPSFDIAYYFDNAVQVFRIENFEDMTGPENFPWLGKSCKMIVREWIDGRDINTQQEKNVSEAWLHGYR